MGRNLDPRLNDIDRIEPFDAMTICSKSSPMGLTPMMWLTLCQILRNKIPGQIVIQVTDRCNAHCPQCGMRVTEPFRRSTLPTEDVKRIIDRAAQNGVKAISFTGGEPLLDLEALAACIDRAGRAGIDYIRTGTNGYLFRNPRQPNFEAKVSRIAEKLARTPLRNFWISIDSALPARHEQMRGFPGVVEGIEKAVPIFHEHGIYPTANLGLNRNIGGQTIPPLGAGSDRTGGGADRFLFDFKRAFRKFYRFVATMGFTIANTCYPMSIDASEENSEMGAIYRANSPADIVRFTAAEKALLFKALLETVPEFRSQIRIFSPLCSLYALYRQQAGDGFQATYGCRGGTDFFFVDAHGNTYPCGYRGKENLGKYWALRTDSPPRLPGCARCEWECFRDPSEFFGPFLEVFARPRHLWLRFREDRDFFRYWTGDIRYYLACDFFNGRIPPDDHKLKRSALKTDEDVVSPWNMGFGKYIG